MMTLLASTHKLIDALNGISKGKYAALSDVCDRIHQESAPLFNAGVSTSTGEMVLAFESLRPEMVKIAGSKATNLATVGNALGLAIPPGFVITAHAFERFLEESGLAAIHTRNACRYHHRHDPGNGDKVPGHSGQGVAGRGSRIPIG